MYFVSKNIYRLFIVFSQMKTAQKYPCAHLSIQQSYPIEIALNFLISFKDLRTFRKISSTLDMCNELIQFSKTIL